MSALDAGHRLDTPEIKLHCPKCDGVRVFKCVRADGKTFCTEEGAFCFLHYQCRNCQESCRSYAIKAVDAGAFDADLYKIGELPPFGPPLPSRLISMVRKDRELFAKGQRAENQGLGIGAFAYYRRVVEHQKNRLFEAILRVARRVQAPRDAVAKLEAALQEQQFSKAVEVGKDAVPEVIRIDGHNPLTLLHSALSHNLHNESDENCLELAGAIRTVLTRLSENMELALRDKEEVKKAVSKLLGNE